VTAAHRRRSCDAYADQRRISDVTRTWLPAVMAAAAVGLAWPAAATASCIAQTPEQQLRGADVVFVGVALEGPSASGVQRFRVDQYVKGSGATVVRVATGVVARSDGTGTVTSVSVEAAAGDRWRIYATRRGDILDTNVCAGSTKLAADREPDPQRPAVAVPSSEAGGGAMPDRLAFAAATCILALVAISAVLFVRRARRAI
jgi:hypothetical protein